MPDPILTDIFKAQVVFQGKSGLPEDVFINNWFFRNDPPPATVDPSPFGPIKRVLDSFYTGAAANGSRVSNFLSAYVQPNFAYHIYDLGQTPPRTRNREVAAPLVGQPATTLPTEVAICLSFYAGSNAPGAGGGSTSAPWRRTWSRRARAFYRCRPPASPRPSQTGQPTSGRPPRT